MLKVIDDRFGIQRAHIDSCHSYTNDQNLIDNYHSKNRRGRGAPLNMVITETGAADAVSKVLPNLKGKLSANAIRVPVPNVSLAILNLTLGFATSVKEVNEYLRSISLDSPLQGQIDYTSSYEVVSSDFVGSLKTGIVDSNSTIVQDNTCVLYVWYDNEFGYACQVVRIVQHIAGLELPSYPLPLKGCRRSKLTSQRGHDRLEPPRLPVDGEDLIRQIPSFSPKERLRQQRELLDQTLPRHRILGVHRWRGQFPWRRRDRREARSPLRHATAGGRGGRYRGL